ncbi:hypothetical protein FE391_37595 [Nonomuraea sp. KC401]|uniref:hypothetical protein n=1 Tax=unclassified Nonomuraea TaxID=2593643 RepID=UPI0010FD44FF|nr:MULTISPECIES: hypothetical protein [unclassified Nonomuraea]NBE98929.1 hypothetical protein [Nonomuraea sp. K271]TLF57646.1 hypothetical protein FE391_37595 [Nonomuraea sp. KC401]
MSGVAGEVNSRNPADVRSSVVLGIVPSVIAVTCAPGVVEEGLPPLEVVRAVVGVVLGHRAA